LARHFSSKGIPVPEIYSVSDDGMVYIQEDLGGISLYDLLLSARKGQTSWDEVEALLCRTMSLLPKIQYEGAEGLDFSICYPQPSFDRQNVMFDLNYFKYCFLKATGLEFNEVLLQQDFERLADDLLLHDTDTFMYRDFNVRNVMVKEGSPYFIDFQGGRRGPVCYDVASFVWQARAAYDDDLKEKLVQSYVDALTAYAEVHRDTFKADLKLSRLFRLLQVLGAYGFRGWTEHKAAFVVSIPSAISNLKELLSELPSDSYPYLMQVLKHGWIINTLHLQLDLSMKL
jgi:aminoglycoside/choline kinase family phosphotransferase